MITYSSFGKLFVVPSLFASCLSGSYFLRDFPWPLRPVDRPLETSSLLSGLLSAACCW